MLLLLLFLQLLFAARQARGQPLLLLALGLLGVCLKGPGKARLRAGDSALRYGAM